MSQRDVIDFPVLERELQAALESERRYVRENDAKLRAVSQRVGSYNEFRDLVLACHLKPLEKKDKEGSPRKQPWNPVAPSNIQRKTLSLFNGIGCYLESGVHCYFQQFLNAVWCKLNSV
uniref:Dynein attachment factor N-terminal domain-containing protein n=1 Tax=Anabas testudineus TaxID=64144 RepID=A0AAQ6INV4_ANATE